MTTAEEMNIERDEHDEANTIDDPCPYCVAGEVGCIGGHHGIGCEHPTCSDCGAFLEEHGDDCPEGCQPEMGA